MKKDEWIKEFDNEFFTAPDGSLMSSSKCIVKPRVKDFIRHLLTSQKKQMINHLIKHPPKATHGTQEWREGFKDAVWAYKTFLESLKPNQ